MYFFLILTRSIQILEFTNNACVYSDADYTFPVLLNLFVFCF
jgi:hypothetical protein